VSDVEDYLPQTKVIEHTNDCPAGEAVHHHNVASCRLMDLGTRAGEQRSAALGASRQSHARET
jgi:hypothetical protein